MGFMDRVKKVSSDVTEMAQDMVTSAVQDKMAEREEQQLDKQEQKELERLFSETSDVGDLSVDARNGLFRVRHASADIKKESGALMKTGKAIAAVYTLGASVAIEHALKPDDRVFRFDELFGYELIEDDSEIVVGGAALQARTRDVYGYAHGQKLEGSMLREQVTKKSIDNLVLRIDLRDVDFPCVFIPYITKPTLTTSREYRKALSKAQQTIACLERIIEQVDAWREQTAANAPAASAAAMMPESVSAVDPIEQVKKLKELMDMGALTQEEFDAKKRQLLGL